MNGVVCNIQSIDVLMAKYSCPAPQKERQINVDQAAKTKNGMEGFKDYAPFDDFIHSRIMYIVTT
jgi:hypothetical protein